MIIKAKTKGDFIKYCNCFKKPVLTYGFGDTELLSYFWLVKDDEEHNCLSVELPGVRLSEKEYLSGNIDDYEKRRKDKHYKYINWMCDLFGEHFDSLLLE